MKVLHDDKGYTVWELTADYTCGWEQSITIMTIEMRHFLRNPEQDDVKFSRITNMRKPKILKMTRKEALMFARALLEDEERRMQQES